jgi:hypothetical protein
MSIGQFPNRRIRSNRYDDAWSNLAGSSPIDTKDA